MKTVEEIKSYIEENGFEDVMIFESPDYAPAFIGVSDEGRAVYDYSLMVRHLAEKDSMTEDEAEEFIQYNTLRALPYYVKGPIVLFKTEEDND